LPRADYVSLADLCRRTNCSRAAGRQILDASGLRFWSDCHGPWLTTRAARQITPRLREAAAEKQATRISLVATTALESVYFISDGENVKIGAALEPRRRLADLQVANARLLTLLFVRPGGFAEETRLHDLFWDHHERGDWFRIEGDLKAFIEAEMRNRDAQSHGITTRTAYEAHLDEIISGTKPIAATG
jgi:hypothetical protein